MYVIKHVKDESTVQTIQGNLRLNSRVENEVCILDIYELLVLKFQQIIS